MFAARYDQPELVHLLIDNGANLDDTNEEGFTALMLACLKPAEEHHTKEGLRRSAAMLVKAGASLAIKNKAGKSALVVALEAGRDDAADVLEVK